MKWIFLFYFIFLKNNKKILTMTDFVTLPRLKKFQKLVKFFITKR